MYHRKNVSIVGFAVLFRKFMHKFRQLGIGRCPCQSYTPVQTPISTHIACHLLQVSRVLFPFVETRPGFPVGRRFFSVRIEIKILAPFMTKRYPMLTSFIARIRIRDKTPVFRREKYRYLIGRKNS